jgi:CRISPR-associated protein Csm4
MMQGTVVYTLRFRAPLHIGERGIGQEETRDYVPADTLFSALCTMWSLLYGVQSLTDDLLTRYGDSGREPFFLTSAFPFAGEVRFYPKPLRPPNSDPESAKRWKSICWVSERVFQAYLNGEPVEWGRQDNTPNGNDRRLLQGGAMLIQPDERQSLQDFWDYEADDLRVYHTAIVPRVVLDRITNASQIWQFGEVHFREGCGLWFAVQFGEPRVFRSGSRRACGCWATRGWVASAVQDAGCSASNAGNGRCERLPTPGRLSPSRRGCLPTTPNGAGCVRTVRRMS